MFYSDKDVFFHLDRRDIHQLRDKAISQKGMQLRRIVILDLTAMLEKKNKYTSSSLVKSNQTEQLFSKCHHPHYYYYNVSLNTGVYAFLIVVQNPTSVARACKFKMFQYYAVRWANA